MSRLTATTTLLFAAVVLCLAGTAARTGPLTTSWLSLTALVVVGVATGLLAYAYVYEGLIRPQQEARRYLEMLSRMDDRELAAGIFPEALPRIDSDAAWHVALRNVQEKLATSATRLADLEHAQASLDLRSRRGSAEFDRMKAVLGSLAEPVLAVDGYDELLLANESAQELFGFTTTSTEKRALGTLVQCETLMNLLTDVRRHKKPLSRSQDLELETTDRGRRTFQVLARPLTDPSAASDERPGVVAVLRDITDQRQMRQRNAEFVSAASHEMKTPLAGIKAYVELLVDGDAEDEATREEFLGVINSQADRLQRLIDNLLNLARIEAGVVKVSKQTQSLNELLDDSFRVVEHLAEGKNIELVKDLSPLYLGVLADRDMLSQAAINLLSNAVKYTPVAGQVSLRSRLVGDAVEFSVEDTGVGLSPEDAEKVFEKFYRVEKDKQMAAGTGLGLPLAKHIVEDVHGGRLTVKSQLGVGSTFTVTLPGAGQLT